MAITSILPRPLEGIMPGGCIPPNERRFPPMPPTDQFGRNCWIPRDRNGTPIQLPAPDAAVQATEATTLLT